MITQALAKNRTTDQSNDEIRSVQSMITDKTSLQKSQQNTTVAFQSQTQTISINLYPKEKQNWNHWKYTSYWSHWNLNSNQLRCIPCFTKPLQVLTKIMGSNSDINTDPDTSGKFTSQDDFTGVTSHHIQFQTPATLPFSKFNRTQRSVPMYIPFTDYVTKLRNQTVTNQLNRINDQTSMLNTIRATVPNVSRTLLALLDFADTYSLSSTNNNPFQKNTISNATGNTFQTL